MEDKELMYTLLKRANALISIASEVAISRDVVSVSQKVHYLLRLGLAPAEVADIIGKPTNYVTALIHTKKKREPTKKRGRHEK